MKIAVKQTLIKIGIVTIMVAGAVLCFFNWWFILGLCMVGFGAWGLNYVSLNSAVLKQQKQEFKKFKEYSQTQQAQKIIRIFNLKEKGIITNQEYEKLKQEIIASEKSD